MHLSIRFANRQSSDQRFDNQSKEAVKYLLELGTIVLDKALLNSRIIEGQPQRMLP